MSDSSDASSEEDFLFPKVDPGAEEFAEPVRKRRRTGGNNKDRAALGIFGSESEDDRPGQRWKSRNLRGKGVGFVSSKTAGRSDGDDGGNGHDSEGDGDEMSGVEVEETAGLRSSTAGGLGWSSAMRASSSRSGSQDQDMGTPLGAVFTASSAQNAYANSRQFIKAESPPPTVSRPSNFGASAKAGTNNKSFAAKMMAKMGYVAGQGLGASGQGIVNPIETKLRPQGAGLGTVKEKTQQAKDEAKREAARRGEVLQDSSEEERKRRKRVREKKKLQGRSGTSTPSLRPKIKYRTVADIEAATEGLKVPNVLKSLIDATGKDHKLLTSTSGLMTPTNDVSDGEATKIARRAKRDLEAFADAWNAEVEKKRFIDAQELQIMAEIEVNNKEVETTRTVAKALESLALDDNASLDEQWDEVVQNLEILQIEFADRFDEFGLTEAAVASLNPLFRRKMEDWSPLEEPEHLVSALRRLLPILGAASNEQRLRRKATTFYESMIVTLWLTKIRTVLVNEWNIREAKNAVSLVEAWKQVIPEYVSDQLLNQIVIPKLITAIRDWKPRSTRKHHHSQPPLHKWLFEWLPLLSPEQRNPKHSQGVVGKLKSRLRTVLDSWDIRRGPLEGLDHLHNLLQTDLTQILHNRLLPRLATHLRTNLEINPQDQDLSPLTDILQWQDHLDAPIMAELLAMEFFPKWHQTLHLWLTSEDPNYDEVGEWFTWWKEQIPHSIRHISPVAEQWQQSLEMIELALELGDRAVDELPEPKVTLPSSSLPLPLPLSSKDTTTNNTKTNTTATTPHTPPEPLTFKDQVDHFCLTTNLLILPIRQPHPTTGLPVFRITASASGKGGVLVYLKGDVVWAKNRKGRRELRNGDGDAGGGDKGDGDGDVVEERWGPVGLDDGLVRMAEGEGRGEVRV